MKISLHRVELHKIVVEVKIQVDKDSIEIRILPTQKHSPAKEDLVTEVNKMYQSQVKNAHHGPTVLLILHLSILIMVLKVTSVEIQFHKKEPKQFGALFKVELLDISGNIVSQLLILQVNLHQHQHHHQHQHNLHSLQKEVSIDLSLVKHLRVVS